MPTSSFFTVAVTVDSELVACGQGEYGQLGLGAVLHQPPPSSQLTPGPILPIFPFAPVCVEDLVEKQNKTTLFKVTEC